MASATLRHELFRSTGEDLGLFDQAAYLISIGETPFSTLLGFHVLGDHAALVWYVLATLYRIHPSLYWLLLFQSFAVAIGIWPMFVLARDAGLSDRHALVMSIAYLLYPVLYNANLADFHPDVLATPLILATVLAARRRRFLWFAAGVLAILSCKAVLGLTVLGMGVWLLLCENRPLYGAVAAGTGLGWFLVATWVVIPYFAGAGATERGQWLYSYLGSTFMEILTNLVTQPWRVFGHLISVSSVGYLAGLLSPVLWGLVPRHLCPLIGAVPQLMLNLLSESHLLRHLTNWYSAPIVPFLLLASLSALATGHTWIHSRRVILAWSVLGFLVFARYPRLVGYFEVADTWRATRAALLRIAPDGGVLVDTCIAPHVAHRRYLYVPHDVIDPPHISPEVQYVLLNVRHPCNISAGAVTSSIEALRTSGAFEVLYDDSGVVVFGRKRAAQLQ